MYQGRESGFKSGVMVMGKKSIFEFKFL